jgi:uncharacterized protein (TIGR00255 family)
MTGYGRSEQAVDERKTSAEARSVNHRFLDISLRMPKILYPLESDIRKLVSAHVSRGKIDINLQYSSQQNGDVDMQIDGAKVKSLYGQLSEIQHEAGIPGTVDMASLLPLRDIFLKEPDSQQDVQLLWAFIKPVLEQALGQLRNMQDAEGAALTDDLTARISQVEALLADIAKRAPEALAARLQTLKERVRQLCDGVAVDEQRMVQEIALLADRSDITEELIRAKSHISQFRKWLASSEAVGKKLDFLLQELNREINTIGSKASDADIAMMVVGAKNELEKIREQVQNVM